MASVTIRWSFAGWRFGSSSRTPNGAQNDASHPRSDETVRRDDVTSAALEEADRAIVAGIQRGDPRAFAALMDDHFNAAASVAYRLLGSRDAAKDAAQQVFAALWERRATFHPVASLRNYIWTTVRNACLDTLRRAKRERRREEMFVEDADESEEPRANDTVHVDDRMTVSVLLARLPERRRRALELRFLDELSYEEIAQVMGISIKSAKHLVARSIDTLRSRGLAE